MNRQPLLTLLAVLSFACSKDQPSEAFREVASKSSTTSAEAVAPPTTTTTIETKTDTATAAPKKKQLPGARTTPKRVTVDTSAPETKVTAHAGEDVILLVPNHAGTFWQITNRDKRLEAPKVEHVAGALGPNTDGERYTFTTAHIPTDTAPEAIVELTNKLAPTEKHVVRIELIQLH